MHIDRFMTFLQSRTTSKETVRAYRQDLNRFRQFLASRAISVENVTAGTVAEFVAHLRETAGRTRTTQLASASITRRLAALSSYFDFRNLESNGEIRNPVRGLRRPKVDNNVPRAVDEGLLRQLSEDKTADLRDQAILLTLLGSGLRLSELVSLDKATIRIRRRTLPTGQVVTQGEGEVIGKGAKRRRFLVDMIAVQAIADYLRERGEDPNPALFISKRRERLSCRSVQDIVHRWCKRLGLPRFNVHALRHSFATRMVNSYMSVTVLQELLGHSSPSITGRYFRLRPERATREFFAANEQLRLARQASSA